MYNSSESPSPPSKKRKRDSLLQAAAYPTALDANGKLKPRRIDPDRLATRLGSDLTADLDKFLVPGAKMPSFAIRQEFVKKYNIDRRHIYDYLHSRGLRVAKEDKHLNLSRKVTATASRKNNKPGKENIPPAEFTDTLGTFRTSVAPKPPKRRKIINTPAIRVKSVTPPPVLPVASESQCQSLGQSPIPAAETFAEVLHPTPESEALPDDYADELVSVDEYCELSQDELPAAPIYHDELVEYLDHALDPAPTHDDPLFALEDLLDLEVTSADVIVPHSPPARFVSLHDICIFSQQDRTSFYDTVNASINIDVLAPPAKRHDVAPLHHQEPPRVPLPASSQTTSMKLKENIKPAPAPRRIVSIHRRDAHRRYSEPSHFVVNNAPLQHHQPLVWTSPIIYPPQPSQILQQHWQTRLAVPNNAYPYSTPVYEYC